MTHCMPSFDNRLFLIRFVLLGATAFMMSFRYSIIIQQINTLSGMAIDIYLLSNNVLCATLSQQSIIDIAILILSLDPCYYPLAWRSTDYLKGNMWKHDYYITNMIENTIKFWLLLETILLTHSLKIIIGSMVFIRIFVWFIWL